ncbi:MAG: hypothetical protein HY299_02035 [Verrucomicrobia bacterium]|nr:hypothetical protein [Verrucomicrobiota bacterium]
MAIALCGLLTHQRLTAQTTQTNITVANVTPSEFTLIWKAPAGSLPDVRVFADEAGTQSLSGQVGVEPFPLHTGYPGATNAFERRASKSFLRSKTTGHGLQSARVRGCAPGTTYYFQVVSSSPAGTNVNPRTAPLPSVTTALRNSFVADSVQVLMEVQGLDVAGRIVTLSHSNTLSSIAAVVGDGAGTNEVWFNLSELMSLDGGNNFTPSGSLRLVAQVLGSGPDGGRVLPVTVDFAGAFSVARSVQALVSTELVALTLGQTVLQAGQTSSVPVSMDSSVPLGALDFTFQIPPGHLSNLVLEAVAPEVDPAKLTLQALANGRWLATILPRSGQSLLAAAELARLRFSAIRGVPSAFVPLGIESAHAKKSDATVANVALFRPGRVVVVVEEPLLEALPGTSDSRSVVLYGKPWFAYGIDSSPTIKGPWTTVLKVALTNLSRTLSLPRGPEAQLFYRAFEANTSPSELQIARRTSNQVDLLVFGITGTNYSVQAAGNISAPMQWHDILSFKLTNSFRSIGGISTTNRETYFRIQAP